MKYKTKFEQWYNKQSVQLILDGCEISPFMQDQITNVLTHRSPTYDQWKNFAYWVKYNVNDDFVQRYDRFSTFSKRDSSSKDIHILRYGEEEGLRRFEAKSKNCTQTKDRFTEKYGNEIGIKKWNAYKEKLSFAHSLEGYIKKYGERKGTIKFNEQRERNSGNLTLERKIELYGEEEGTKKFNTMKKTLSKRHSLENYIRLFGIEEGSKKWNAICAIRSYKNSMDYYIEKYGEEEGLRRIKEVKNNSKSFNSYSKISLSLFNELKHFSDQFGENESSISLTRDEKEICGLWTIKPDFIMDNKIIEFHGDVFHGNPNIFSKEDICNPFDSKLTAGMIWEKDSKRTRILENRGYKVMVIWEDDFKKYKEETVKKCIEFLKEEN